MALSDPHLDKHPFLSKFHLAKCCPACLNLATAKRYSTSQLVQGLLRLSTEYQPSTAEGQVLLQERVGASER